MGIIHARPYDDPSNTVTVDNSDPKAYNKLYAGIAGTHLEQHCCDDKPPSRLPQMTGWYVDDTGNHVCEIIEYWSRPENRDRARDGWWNAETPPGLGIEMANTGMLMCEGCFGTAWDQFMENLSRTIDELLPVIEGISIAASYFPVIGTAVSFLLDSSVNLAKGRSLDEAALDAIGDSLPGQPATGAAYRVVRTIVREGSLDEIALSALPVDDSARAAIASSLRIGVAFVNGEEITQAALEEIYSRLPETGKRGIDVARRIINGEDVQELVVSEATKAAAQLAKSRGEMAINRFIAESGFQSSVETMEPYLQAALRTGIVAGSMEAHQLIGEFNANEEHVDRNDALAAKGKAIIASGATWRGRKLPDIRSGNSFAFTRKELDPLTHTEQMRTNVHHVSDEWRRGFDVAIGLCEGRSSDDEEQQRVRLSLGKFNTQQGFDAGQFIQHTRTSGEWHQFIAVDVTHARTEVERPNHQDHHDPAVDLETARRQGIDLAGPIRGPQ
jgi:hypothetical protein